MIEIKSSFLFEEFIELVKSNNSYSFFNGILAFLCLVYRSCRFSLECISYVWALKEQISFLCEWFWAISAELFAYLNYLIFIPPLELSSKHDDLPSQRSKFLLLWLRLRFTFRFFFLFGYWCILPGSSLNFRLFLGEKETRCSFWLIGLFERILLEYIFLIGWWCSKAQLLRSFYK